MDVVVANEGNVTYRCCTECGKKKAWTKVNFARDKHSKGLQLICRPCKRSRATRNKLARMEQAALDLFIKKAGSGGNSIPHSAEMLESVVNLFGGANGVASAMLKQYYDATPGGRIRSQMLEMITRLTLKNTEMGGAKRPLELYSQEELEEEMARTVRQVYTIEGQVHESHTTGLADSGLICSGQNAGTPSGDYESPHGGAAALFPDSAAAGVPRGHGK